MERLMFPYLKYTHPPRSLCRKKINTWFIYAVNAPEERVGDLGLDERLSSKVMRLKMPFGASESLLSFDTYQFNDYSKVVADFLDFEKKAKRREEISPRDCEKAFDMAVGFARKNRWVRTALRASIDDRQSM